VTDTGNIYDQIREENIRKYGTEVNKYGPVLLANLYSDKTHFVYELLQNAEDACERARKEVKRDFFVNIQLFSDHLEVRHNGIEFDEEDLRGICGLVEGTKDTDLSQIGKFGIGFKSVYAYTNSPEVYSGDKSFTIKNYVQPHGIEKRNDLQNEETLFVIPFDRDEISVEGAFSNVKERLRSLGLRTLLFLRNIKDISWKTDTFSGRYSRKIDKEKIISDNIKRAHLLYEENGISKESEEWLIFEKSVTINNKKTKVEVAYLLHKDDKTNKKQVIPAKNTELVVFFPTQKETHLKFLIQGPYRTTPARDNISYPHEWNESLIKETAILVVESISKIKEMNLLDISFLNTMPLQKDDFPEGTMLKYIYDVVKEKLLGDEALLPSDNGNYITAENALLARGEELRNLLSSKQLTFLFRKEDAKWLDKNITQDKTPELRNYLMQEIKILEIDPEKFARKFTKYFIRQQDDDWVKQFYGFLLDQKALWREKRGYYSEEGPLRSKPIIRLIDYRHTAPFNADGKPLAYLPSKSSSYFPTVKENIADDKKAKDFLKHLGLTEPDDIAYVADIILPKYQQKEIKVKENENIQHVKQIIELLQISPQDTRRADLLKKLREIPFLLAKNIVNSKIAYRKPKGIYIGETYTKNKTLEIYFEGNDTIWFLDEQYISKDIDILKKIGCETKVRVSYRKPNYDGNVIIHDVSGHHERGIDGFDPDCNIDGLIYALRNINLKRAEIIWSILKKHYKSIYGTVETCSRQDYTNSEREERYSAMGVLLTKYSWLPDEKGNFHKSSEFLLSDLHEMLDKESLEARHVAEKLDFKRDVEQELLEWLPEEKKIVCEQIIHAPEETVKKIRKLLEKEEVAKTEIYPPKIYDEFQGAFVSKGITDTDESDIKEWTGIHPDEEKRIRIEYGNELLKRLKNPQVSTITKISVSKEIREEDTTDPKQFLLEQYDGHCQICNAILDLGSNRKPYFEIYRLIETRGKNWWTNNEFNVLCLCPNCHALMKYGGREIKNILETAKKILNRGIAPEEVDERGGDFYVIKINVAGKEREVFYSPRHMETLAAFIDKTAEKGNENIEELNRALEDSDEDIGVTSQLDIDRTQNPLQSSGDLLENGTRIRRESDIDQNLPKDIIQKDEEKIDYQELEQELEEIKKKIEKLSKNYKIK